jgi:hypothetical protein
VERVCIFSVSSYAIPLLTPASVVGDESPMPPVGANEDEEAILLQNEPYVDGPVKADYGYNIK